MNRKQIVKGVLIAAALIAVAAAVFGVIYLMDNRSTGKVEHESAAPDPDYLYLGDLEYEVTDILKTYLIVGTDGNGTKPGAKHYHGPMADYQLLLVINQSQGTYGFVQIDRDTITDVAEINNKGEEDEAFIAEEQICTATWFGKNIEQGLLNLCDSVSNLLGGIEIDGYYSINMDDIKTLNHAVGGVTVKIEDDFSEYDEEMVPGATVHLTDDQAELFVRSRMEIGDGKNESRMRRQRVYMDALMASAREKMAEDKSFPTELYSALQDISVTNIPGGRISAIANLLYQSKDTGMRDIEGEHKLGKLEGDKKDYVQFYADEDSITKVMIDLCHLDEGREY